MKTYYVLMVGDIREKQKIIAETYTVEPTRNAYQFFVGSDVVAEFPYAQVKNIVHDVSPKTLNLETK